MNMLTNREYYMKWRKARETENLGLLLHFWREVVRWNPDDIFVGPAPWKLNESYSGKHRGKENTFECPCGLCPRFAGKHRRGLNG